MPTIAEITGQQQKTADRFRVEIERKAALKTDASRLYVEMEQAASGRAGHIAAIDSEERTTHDILARQVLEGKPLDVEPLKRLAETRRMLALELPVYRLASQMAKARLDAISAELDALSQAQIQAYQAAARTVR
ncbi:MAG TPA: hypothetical protein VLV45_03335 [Gemmatimonadales bacterium]|nr:hypothetical protein [Gemmatimonadales bacterium]